MKKRMTRILVSTLLAATVCTPLFTTTTVMAESATDPAPSVDCQVKLTHFFVESCPTLAADKVGVLRWVNSICQS